jgi:hypothetical protein
MIGKKSVYNKSWAAGCGEEVMKAGKRKERNPHLDSFLPQSPRFSFLNLTGVHFLPILSRGVSLLETLQYKGCVYNYQSTAMTMSV